MRRLSRRELLAGGGLTAAGFALGFATNDLINSWPNQQEPANPPASAADALQFLLQGNQRFVSGLSVVNPNQSTQLRAQLAGGQSPWAIVLGCVDSRVPPELVFDLGLGDIFVARSAGQVIDDAVMGSIEFGVEEFNSVKLVMVLGHQNCGAVKAAIQTIQANGHAPGKVQKIVDAIKPAMKTAQSQPGDIVDNTVRANVSLEVASLMASDVISHAVSAGSIGVVGAKYDLTTGRVDLTVPMG